MPNPKADMVVNVAGDEIIVSLAQSAYLVAYYRPLNTRHLLARRMPLKYLRS
jgi:hypothetical protein